MKILLTALLPVLLAGPAWANDKPASAIPPRIKRYFAESDAERARKTKSLTAAVEACRKQMKRSRGRKMST